MTMLRLRIFILLVLLGLWCAAVFPLPVSGQYTMHFGRNKVQYERFDWHVLKTEHFDIYYYPEMQELAEYGASFAEEAYDELQNRFNFSLTHRPPLIFYSSNLHFRQTNTTPGFIPAGVGGFFEFLKGRVVIPANGNIHQFRRVIRHELVHVFTYAKVLRVVRDHRIPPERFLPLWFTEGLAEHWSGDPDASHAMLMRDAVYSNYLIPLENIYRINGSYLMYKEGEALCRFFAETYGEEKLLKLIENFWKDRDFRRVMEVTFLEPYRTIDRKWQSWLRRRYFGEIDEVQISSIIAQGVATEGYSAKPVFFTFPNGTRKVYFVGNRMGYSNVYEVEVDDAFQRLDTPRILIRGERTGDFESLHMFESRMSVSEGGRLAFVAKSGESDVIHVYDLIEDELEETFSFDGIVVIHSPDWSPDGSHLVFSAIDRSGFSDLYTYGVESGTLRRLTQDSYDDRDPSWSPDGRRVAFSSDRTSVGWTNAYNLFAIDLETGAIDYITFGDRLDYSPRWSPDGRRVLFASAVRDSAGHYGAQDIWMADIPQGGLPVATPISAGAVPGVASDASTSQAGEHAGTSTSPVGGPAEEQLIEGNGPDVADYVRVGGASGSGGASPDVDGAGAGVDASARTTGIGSTERPRLRRLTNLTAAAFDPIWAEDGRILFTSFEHMRFSVRSLSGVDSLWAYPRSVSSVDWAGIGDHWNFSRIDAGDRSKRFAYKRKYTLDIAQTMVSQNPVWGTYGGAALAFSDLMGNDHWSLMIYNNSQGTSDFLRSLNFAVSRVQLHRRTNIGYGIYRYAGLRYDITDPDASRNFPTLWETIYGGYGAISYPISMFRRVEVSTSVGSDHKYIPWAQVDRRALLVSNAVSIVHDNVLWGMNGPMEGYRGSLTAAYTTDVLYANVRYLTMAGDMRHYWRPHRHVTFASRGMIRMNEGREARLFFMGGSWDLRGFPLFSVRGKKMWFTSHELRFPLVASPWLSIPILAPLGLANLRGALFFDAAHAWNDDYHEVRLTPERRRQINIGETMGAVGAGLRLNLFGALVLRYDVGYRYRDGFRKRDRFFKQFFFGWDF